MTEIHNENESVEQESQVDEILEEVESVNEFEVLKAEKEEVFNRLQRLQADFENYRRRTRIEKEETLKYASESIISQLLPVVDNFERALSSVKDGGGVEKFSEGIEMILRQLMQVLNNEGVTQIDAVGCTFDPQCHDAVMQVEEEGYEENTVVEELLRGYKLKDKVIRPSMVKVTK